MSRASRARRIAAAAAYGGGGLTFLTAAGIGLVTLEARLARRMIGQPFGSAGPEADGLYGHGPGTPIELAFLGDSSADGLGVDEAEQTAAVIIATGVAAVTGRRVRLTNVAEVGAESKALVRQLDRLLVEVPHPDVAVILVGANDVTHRVKPSVAVRALAETVSRLRTAGTEVVVGTCPDLGTLGPVAQPLRLIARRLSREMAAAQTIASVEAGARTVSLADILGAEFSAARGELFSADQFHPSAAGYARVAAALLPSVCAVLGYWPDGGHERAPERRRGERVAPIAQAAVAAADDPGTEVAGTQVAGFERGQFGRWAVLLRRRRQPAQVARDAVAPPDGERAATPLDGNRPATPPDGELAAARAGADGVGAVSVAVERPRSDAAPSAATDR